jgi:hypothetical protein
MPSNNEILAMWGRELSPGGLGCTGHIFLPSHSVQLHVISIWIPRFLEAMISAQKQRITICSYIS